MMKLTEIRKARKKLESQRDEIKQALERVKLEMRLLTTQCAHKNGKTTYSMGDRGFYCPDCGHST